MWCFHGIEFFKSSKMRLEWAICEKCKFKFENVAGDETEIRYCHVLFAIVS